MDGNEIQATEVIDNPYYTGHQVGEVPQFIFEQEATVMLSGGMGGRAIQIEFLCLVPNKPDVITILE